MARLMAEGSKPLQLYTYCDPAISSIPCIHKPITRKILFILIICQIHNCFDYILLHAIMGIAITYLLTTTLQLSVRLPLCTFQM